MAEGNLDMDCLYTGNYENGFDDNGLQHAFILAPWEEIPSKDCMSENDANDSQLSHSDAVPIGSGEDEDDEVATDKRRSFREALLDDEGAKILLRALPNNVRVIHDDESKQLIPNDKKYPKREKDQKENLQLPDYYEIKKEGAKNVDGGSAIRSDELEANDAKLRSVRSAKDGGCLQSITQFDTSLACFWSIFWATFSCQYPVSLTIGILLLLPSVGVGGALTSVPASTLVAVGKTTRINCSTDLNQPVYWARTPVQHDEQQWLYYGTDGFHSTNTDTRFSIVKDEATGKYDLIISDVQQKDAGQYACFEESGLGASVAAELVVSDPIKCNSHVPNDGVMGNNVFGIEQDLIEISCSLTYTGNLSPTLEWIWPGSKVQGYELNSFATKSTVTSALKLSPTKEQNDVRFQCKANIEGHAQYNIDSGLLWKSETIKAKYAEFAPEGVDACPGVEISLVCNPPCSYSFEENKDHQCRCLYTYYDKRTQQSYQFASHAVTCGKDNAILLVVPLSLGAVIAFVVATAVASTCYLKRRRTEQHAVAVESGISIESSEAMLKEN